MWLPEQDEGRERIWASRSQWPSLTFLIPPLLASAAFVTFALLDKPGDDYLRVFIFVVSGIAATVGASVAGFISSKNLPWTVLVTFGGLLAYLGCVFATFRLLGLFGVA